MATAWPSAGSTTAPTRPSWLAPPLESQTFSIATPVEPESEPPAPDLAQASPLDGERDLDIADLYQPDYPDLRAENAELHRRLDTQARAFSAVRGAVLAASEGELVRLACAIAERVIGRELTLDPAVVLAWAREGIAALSTGEAPHLAVSEDVGALLSDPALSDAVAALATFEVDRSLPSFACEVRTRTCRIDASLAGRLASVAEDLE
jgi:hypothetical protein